MENLLWYECTPRPFVVPENEHGHQERVGRLDVAERLDDKDERRPYVLRMQAPVADQEEADECHHEAFRLAGQLNTVWPYVAGDLLFPMRATLQVVHSPEGWNSNFKELSSALPTKRSFQYESIEFHHRSFITLPYMPLQNALQATRALEMANETTRTLIELHVEALSHPASQSGLFLLAKALELARAMLPGRTDAKRQAALPTDITSHLRQSLHWLYGIANERLEIRHVVDKKVVDKNKLLPQLAADERKDFLHDANLIISSLVSIELGLPLAITKER